MADHDYPGHLRYTPEHEWVLPDGAATAGAPGGVRVGITGYAQGELGDIVYVALPEVGAHVDAGQTCGEVESTKSVSDLFAPVTGTVLARNDSLDGSPELVNSDPYGEGWLVEIAPDDPAEVATLLDAEGYRASLG